MAKVLGIDYGDVRIGLAFAETEIGIAHPHSVIASDENAVAEISKIIRDEIVETIVVGLPKNMNGTEGGQAEIARKFAENLTSVSGIEIIFQDERLTSRQAEAILIKMDKSREERKNLADAHQAAIILQTYLDSIEEGKADWDS